MTLGAGDSILCSGTLRADISFRGAHRSGRDGASPGCRSGAATIKRRSTKGCVTGISACCWPITASPWVSSTSRGGGCRERPTSRFRRSTTTNRSSVFGEPELFAVAEAVGARSLNAVDIFGGSWSFDEAAAAFAGLCDRAAEHGLLVHLEFLPWSRIPDLSTAWQVVRAADRPNGGVMLDAWHYFRSGSDGALLRSIPGESILGIQLCDAPATPEPNPLHATLHDCLLPGDGELPLPSLLADLRATGTNGTASGWRCSPTSSMRWIRDRWKPVGWPATARDQSRPIGRAESGEGDVVKIDPALLGRADTAHHQACACRPPSPA